MASITTVSTKTVVSPAVVSPATDNADSLRRCAVVVACWCLAIGLLPPNGLLWQFGSLDGLGHWLINGMLACLASVWARFDWTRSLVALFAGSREGSPASDRGIFVAQD